MKSIKDKAAEVFPSHCNANTDASNFKKRIGFEAGANYVLDAIIECMPKTHSFNPNEVIDIIASVIKELKK